MSHEEPGFVSPSSSRLRVMRGGHKIIRSARIPKPVVLVDTRERQPCPSMSSTRTGRRMRTRNRAGARQITTSASLVREPSIASVDGGWTWTMLSSSLRHDPRSASSHALPGFRVTGAAKEMVMSPQPLATRVERLEQRMTALEELPARVEALELQIVQLRGEMHGEFAALRIDMRAGDEETRRVLREELGKSRDELIGQFRGELRGEIGELRDDLRGEIGQLRDDLRGEMGQLRNDLRGEIGQVRDDLHGEIGQVRDNLGGEITAMGDRLEAAIQEARDHSRVMFEEVLERIARIGEGSSRRPRRKS
jgi:hypothetical protein